MEAEQVEMLIRMKEILQEQYMHLRVRSYTVHEDLEGAHEGAPCKISCDLVSEHGEKLSVEGSGVGTIDAFFNALRTRLADEYPSLRSIEFSDFSIRGLFSNEDSRDTNADAEATVGILNSEGREFIFKATASSVSRAGLQATVHAAEYFVNSERTFVRLHEILSHYRSEGRSDLVQKYTTLMSEVVKNTSYSEVVERIQKEL